QLGVADLPPVDLDQPVHRLRLQFRRMMLVAVPFGISRRIRQPEVGRQVDDLGRWRGREQVLDHLLRRRMRQRAEGDVEPRPDPVEAVQRHKRRQFERRELREHVAHLLAGRTFGGEQRDLDLGMAQQQPHQFGAGVAGGAEDADLCLAGHQTSPLSASAAAGRLAGFWYIKCGRSATMRAAIACAAGSSCAESRDATATWSGSVLFWLSLNLPSMVSTSISMTTMARTIGSSRAGDTVSAVHGSARPPSKRAVSASRWARACSAGTMATGPDRCTVS